MIHTCELCRSDFLTEADCYVVRPTPTGIKLYCYCQIKGFDEMIGAEGTIADLNQQNKKLREALAEIAQETRVVEGVECSTDGAIIAAESLKEIGE